MKNKNIITYFAMNSHIFDWVPDKIYLQTIYYLLEGEKLDLNNPCKLNEKLQWLKLYNRNPLYTTLVDKYLVKQYVAKRIGEDYIIPTLGVWEHFDDIDFDLLPNQFVLKCTHDSGSLIICKDKNNFDKKSAKAKIERCLKRNYYWTAREWPYKNVHPRVIAEPYLKDSNSTELTDYKFYCYGEKPRYFMVSFGEAEHNVRNHKFDMTLHSIDYLFKKKKSVDENDITLPTNIDKMISIVEALSVGFQHIRIDLYNIQGKIYFGEMTFSSGGGFINIDSDKLSSELAGYIDLSKCK